MAAWYLRKTSYLRVGQLRPRANRNRNETDHGLSLREGIALDGDLELVGRLNGLFGLGIDGPWQIGILGGMDGLDEVKPLLSLFLLSV